MKTALEKLDDLLDFMQRSDWWTLEADAVERNPHDFSNRDIAEVRETLTQGGLVLDCGNIWCKSGDNVRFFATSASEERTGELVFDTDLYKWQVDGMDLGDVYEWYRI